MRRLLPLLVVLSAFGCASAERRPEPVPEVVMDRTAPDTFRVRFETSKGDFVVESVRAWAPHGVDRFYTLVETGFFDDTRAFRVLPGFVVQFGLSGDPALNSAWRARTLPDDPVVESNEKGSVTFAMAGPDTRTTQLFVNLADNPRLDTMGFSPIGKVVDGMEVVEQLFAGYGEGAPRGRGPDQGRIQSEGNSYLDRDYPRLDAIRKATVVAE